MSNDLGEDPDLKRLVKLNEKYRLFLVERPNEQNQESAQKVNSQSLFENINGQSDLAENIQNEVSQQQSQEINDQIEQSQRQKVLDDKIENIAPLNPLRKLRLEHEKSQLKISDENIQDQMNNEINKDESFKVKKNKEKIHFDQTQFFSQNIEFQEWEISDYKCDLQYDVSQIDLNSRKQFLCSQIYKKEDKIQMITQYSIQFFKSINKVFLFFLVFKINDKNHQFDFKNKILLDVIPIKAGEQQINTSLNVEEDEEQKQAYWKNVIEEIDQKTNLNGVVVNKNFLYYFSKHQENNKHVLKLVKQEVGSTKKMFIDEFQIDMPENSLIKAEDTFTINFLQFIGQSDQHEDDEISFLKNRFVVIQSNDAKTVGNDKFHITHIYKLSDPKNQYDILNKRSKKQIMTEKFYQGVHKLDDKMDILTFFYKQYDNRKLKWINKISKFSFSSFDKNFEDYKKLEIIYDCSRINNQYIEPLQLDVCLDGQNVTNQQFFVTCNGHIQLIHPLYQDEQLLQTEEFIKKKLGIQSNEKVINLFFRDKILFSHISQTIKKLLQEKLGEKNVESVYQHIIFTEELIIGFKNNQVKEQDRINILFMQDAQKQKQIKDIIGEQNSILQKKILENYQSNFSDSFYINKDKEVYSTHNKVFIKDEIYEFNEKYLVIHIKDGFRLLNLDFKNEEEKVELIKYHTSKTCIIFFFIYRDQNGKGVHFFIIDLIENIEEMDFNSILVNNDTKIYVPVQINNIIECKFDEIKNYCEVSKFNIKMGTDIIFETVRDLGEPINDFLPFIYNQWVNNACDSGDCFDHYICFFNVEAFKERLQEQRSQNQSQNNKKDSFKKVQDEKTSPQKVQAQDEEILSKNCQIDFSEYIQVFKNHFYQKQNERQLLKSRFLKNQGYRQNVQSINLYSQQLFVRSSIWRKEKGHYQAYYQIGNNLEFGKFQAIEMKQYQVTINLQNDIYCNMDQKLFKKQFTKNLNSKVKVVPIRLDFFSYSQKYSESEHKEDEKIIMVKHEIEKNRMIPQIEDNGDVNGSYLLIYKESQIWKKVQNKWENNSKEENYDIINVNQKLRKTLQYEPLCKISINKLKFRYDKDLIYQSSIELGDDCIKNEYFNNIQSYQILYKYQKQILGMRLSSYFQALFFENIKKVQKSNYFQPLEILDGKSICSLDLDQREVYNPQLFDVFLKDQEPSNYDFLKGSILDQSIDLKDSLELLVNNLDLDKYFELKYDFVKQIQLLQKLINENMIAQGKQIIRYMINNFKGKYGQSILSVDLPQILNSHLFNINEFLNFKIVQSERRNYFHQIDIHQKMFQFEQNICGASLQVFDDDEQKATYMNNNKGVTFLIDNIVEQLEEQKKNNVLKNFQVYHTLIQLEEIFLKMKIELIKKKDPENISLFYDHLNFVCCEIKDFNGLNDLILSKIFKLEQKDLNIDEQSTVKKIIDLQFAKTVFIAQIMFWSYLIFFCVPFFIFVGRGYQALKYKFIDSFLLNVCGLTQILFFTLEICEINYIGFVNYILDGWNFFDFLQPIIFFIVYFKDQITVQGSLNELINRFLLVLMILLASTKILQLYRYNESYCIFVYTFIAVIFETIPFFVIFFVFTFMSSMTLIIMDSKNGDDEEFFGVSNFIRAFVQTFRTQIGDIQIYQMNFDEGQKLDTYKKIEIAILWATWFLNISLMLIIMLNLLIAKVGAVHEKVQEQRDAIVYLIRSQINQLVIQIFHFFGYRDQFNFIVIQQPLEDQDNQNELNIQTQISNFQTSQQQELSNIKKQLDEIQKSIALQK